MSFRPVSGSARPAVSACRKRKSLVNPGNRDGNIVVRVAFAVETGYALPIRYLGIGRDEHLPKSPSPFPHAESP